MKHVSQTRFKLAFISTVATIGITFFSVQQGMEGVAVTGLGSLAAIITYYSKKETENPSKIKDNE
jgi:hypothetical protein